MAPAIRSDSLQRQRRKRRPVLTDAQVAALPRRPATYFHPDPELQKFGIRVRPTGAGTYTVIMRDRYGKQRWIKVGTTELMKIDEAREIARSVIRRVEKGLEPIEPLPVKPDSVAAVIAQWLKRHVVKNKLRSAAELERVCAKYIVPNWGERIFVEIKRKDIANLLDMIEDEHGPAMADAVLSALRAIAAWVQSRDDDYEVPFTKNMRRVPEQNRKRKRMLDDDELRRVWHAAANADAFGAIIRLLLLTAQRREKILTLRWSDIDAGGVWTIRKEAREKGNAGSLKLPDIALSIIRAQPRFAGNEFVFGGGRGRRAFNFSRLKADFDRACAVQNWRLHDLRRTSRSLMSRAAVLSEHAERVLGHAIDGVEGIYDRHQYTSEKAAALAKLAALVERIVAGPSDNVVPLHETAAS
jgi:integrase